MTTYLRIGSKLLRIPRAKKLIRFVLIGGLLTFVAYIAISCWLSNQPKQSEIPERAKYAFVIRNTGVTFLTESYKTRDGVYYLDGFWDNQKDRWIFHDRTFSIDPRIWGTVTIQDR